MNKALNVLTYIVGLSIVALGGTIIGADPLQTMHADFLMRLGGLVVAIFGALIVADAVEDSFR